MALTPAQWVALVEKMEGYVATYLALAAPTAEQKAKLAADLGTLAIDMRELAASLVPVDPPAPTPTPAPVVPIPSASWVDPLAGAQSWEGYV